MVRCELRTGNEIGLDIQNIVNYSKFKIHCNWLLDRGGRGQGDLCDDLRRTFSLTMNKIIIHLGSEKYDENVYDPNLDRRIILCLLCVNYLRRSERGAKSVHIKAACLR